MENVMGARIVFILLLGAVGASVLAQSGPGQGFSNFIDANEKFGRKLLRQTHSSAPGQNVAVSPLPVSFAFALLKSASYDEVTLDEIQRIFGWTHLQNLAYPSRMLLAIFQRPLPRLAPAHPQDRFLNLESPESLWMSSTFTYRGKGTLAEMFAARGKRDYGVEFRSVSQPASRQTTVSPAENSGASSPDVAKHDLWILSTTHLRTAWADNTFSMGTKKNDEFVL
jgi:hypothetical protein